jgi:hypothetical protein
MKKSRTEKLESLRRLKKEKAKYYRKTKSEGQILYGQGGESRTGNTVTRGKRRYGFQRNSVRQKHRVKKSILDYKSKFPNRKYRCYTFQSYLYTRKINSLYQEGKMNQVLELFYKAYSNLDVLLDDYRYGYRDLLFSKVVSLTGIYRDDDTMQLFKCNYDDLIIDTLVQFIDTIDNFVSTDKSTFYTYMINIIPYRISTLLYSLNDNIIHEEIDLDEIDSGYKIDIEQINPLGVYILEKLSDRRCNREYLP